MLSGLLSKEECAKCRICCEFGDDDLWETPFVDKEKQQEIKALLPEAEFFQYGGSSRVGLVAQKTAGLYYCQALDCQSGCKLGDKKPFDCRIWPFRVMKLKGLPVLTISPVCPAVMKKPLADIYKTAEKIAPLAFSYAAKYPQTVRDYIEGYPIIII